ncbi:MAG: alpha-1,2-fucosyltransferase [Myxococcales bacterium]|nr:alpha-1,2-fucosyltransferase [Myxococcales bacterium]
MSPAHRFVAPAAHAVLRSIGAGSDVYGYPQMVRAGLGHMMGAWARCVVWSRKNGVPMLAPQWRQLRIGPYLRRERDKRAYHKLFRSEGYVGGALRLLCLAIGRRVDEDHAGDALQRRTSAAPTLVVFYEDRGFDTLRDDHALLLHELLRITRPEYVRAAFVDRPFIGVHVRRGDFTRPPSDADLRAGRRNQQTPIEWYAAAVSALRRGLGAEHPVRLFSDGTEAELAPVLRLPGVEFVAPRTAITDILSLSQARVLVASGSGFSQWAGFLGQMPSVWFPSQKHHRLRGGADGANWELEWERDASMPQAFLGAVASGWLAPSPLRNAVTRVGGR